MVTNNISQINSSSDTIPHQRVLLSTQSRRSSPGETVTGHSRVDTSPSSSVVSEQVPLPNSSWLLTMLIHVCRRSKYKRLAMEDQERQECMRRSRALPTLQPTFREARPIYGSAVTDHLMPGGGVFQRPSQRLEMGRMDTAYNSMNPPFTNQIPSPVSIIGSANQSPISLVNEGLEHPGPFSSATQVPFVTTPRFMNPCGRSHSLSSMPPTVRRQGRSFNQKGIMELNNPPVATISPPSSLVANSAYDYASLPPLQCSRTSFQTLDDERSSSAQPAERPSHAGGRGVNQHYINPLPMLSSLSYDQSPTLYPSSSAFSAPSHYRSQDTTCWQAGQTG